MMKSTYSSTVIVLWRLAAGCGQRHVKYIQSRNGVLWLIESVKFWDGFPLSDNPRFQPEPDCTKQTCSHIRERYSRKRVP